MHLFWDFVIMDKELLRREVGRGLRLAGFALFIACNLPAQPASPPTASSQDPGKQAPGAAAGTGSDPAKALPAFEVVSVKPNKSDSMGMRIAMTPDGISLSGVPLHMMLREAFGVSNDRIVAEPGWANTARFDIEARVAAADLPALKDLKPAQWFAMLLPVLQERFGLKFHRETRDLTVYALVIGKGGVKMKEADPNDTYANGFRPPNGASGAGMMRMSPGEFLGQGIPVANLVRQLSLVIGSTVVDNTGLAGKYDIDLKWEPDEGSGLMMRTPVGGGPPPTDAPPAEGTGPSIFTAVQEQLGLKLESRKEPVDVIVIDHIDQPSEN
jgi:uncharacterized protein (TIGR03435 family)